MGQLDPAAQCLGQGVRQRAVRHGYGQQLERPADRRVAVARRTQHALAGLGDQLLRGPVVDGLEMRRHAGLEREPAQESAAQGVDRHDREPARQLEYPREQTPRALDPLAVRRPAGKRLELGHERRIVPGGGPGRQPLLDPHRHLGCRGLGEGDAQDAFGVAPLQQQAQHAVGQHPGFAGAGIRGHPDRVGGVGRAALRWRRGALAGHGSASVPCHSPTRARCS